MDSRVEELAHIIHERAKTTADRVASAAGIGRGDLYENYRRIQNLSLAILELIDDYRHAHPEDYLDSYDLLVKVAVDAERERCLNIVEGFDSCDPKYIAAAIRGEVI